ncbi:MAG TPA: hypothetical protein PL033_05615 [Candidatus Brocadiia bacterium]|nr:hypothetical protein [Candidatus Brocadiia bacterium]
MKVSPIKEATGRRQINTISVRIARMIFTPEPSAELLIQGADLCAMTPTD